MTNESSRSRSMTNAPPEKTGVNEALAVYALILSRIDADYKRDGQIRCKACRDVVRLVADELERIAGEDRPTRADVGPDILAREGPKT